MTGDEPQGKWWIAFTPVPFAVAALTVAIVVTTHGEEASRRYGPPATWFAIATGLVGTIMAIIGYQHAQRQLTHARDVANNAELDRQANQVITHRRNAIRAIGEYARLVDEIEPLIDKLEPSMNESFYQLVNQMGHPDKLPAFETLEVLRAHLNGPVYQNYLLAYSEIKETPLAEHFNQLYIVVLNISDRVNRMINDLNARKADMSKVGELRIVLNQSSSTQAQIVDMIRAGEVPLDYSSVIDELRHREP